MRIFKFGGASVKDAKGVKNLLDIVRHATDDLVVVISAMGKTTNALERIVDAIIQGDKRSVESQWQELLSYHEQIADALGVKLQEVVPEVHSSQIKKDFVQP